MLQDALHSGGLADRIQSHTGKTHRFPANTVLCFRSGAPRRPVSSEVIASGVLPLTCCQEVGLVRAGGSLEWDAWKGASPLSLWFLAAGT